MIAHKAGDKEFISRHALVDSEDKDRLLKTVFVGMERYVRLSKFEEVRRRHGGNGS